jgi:WD40 repeat protein
VRIWETNHWRQQSVRPQKYGVVGVAFSPAGRRLAISGGYDHTVWLVELANGERTPLRGHTNGVMGVAFSPDGQQLASAGNDHTVRVWDVGSDRNGKVTAAPLVLEGHKDVVSWVAYSPDGKRLASGSYDGTVKVWDAATGHECVTLRGHKERVNCVAFSPDGARLASTSMDGTVRIWDGTPWLDPNSGPQPRYVGRSE